MKTIGIIGGISWHSTAVYYNQINQLIHQKLGSEHSAKIILHSVNYEDYKKLQKTGDWKGVETLLGDMAIKIEKAGADCILLCCNTAHIIADKLIKKINIPFLHIAKETAGEIVQRKLKTVGLLGTKYTMENSFFIWHLANAGINTIIPEEKERNEIHTAILEELSSGVLTSESKVKFQSAIQQLKSKGAEAIVFACTEIGIAIKQEDCELPILDTTIIHSTAAVEFSLRN